MHTDQGLYWRHSCRPSSKVLENEGDVALAQLRLTQGRLVANDDVSTPFSGGIVSQPLVKSSDHLGKKKKFFSKCCFCTHYWRNLDSNSSTPVLQCTRLLGVLSDRWRHTQWIRLQELDAVWTWMTSRLRTPLHPRPATPTRDLCRTGAPQCHLGVPWCHLQKERAVSYSWVSTSRIVQRQPRRSTCRKVQVFSFATYHSGWYLWGFHWQSPVSLTERCPHPGPGLVWCGFARRPGWILMERRWDSRLLLPLQDNCPPACQSMQSTGKVMARNYRIWLSWLCRDVSKQHDADTSTK